MKKKTSWPAAYILFMGRCQPDLDGKQHGYAPPLLVMHMTNMDVCTVSRLKNKGLSRYTLEQTWWRLLRFLEFSLESSRSSYEITYFSDQFHC